jgi:hypothetical protein
MKLTRAAASKDRLLRAVAGAALCAAAVTSTVGRAAAQAPLVQIASGSVQTWRWNAETSPSLLASWDAWQHYRPVRESERLAPRDWRYPALSWRRAFGRAYELANYLLGQKPLPLHATVVLVPEGSDYHQTPGPDGPQAVPILLAFPYPAEASSSRSEQARRLGAFFTAYAGVMQEYYRALVSAGLIVPAGKNKTDKQLNEKALGVCWDEATSLALLATGPHFHSWVNWVPWTSPPPLAHRPNGKVQPGDVEQRAVLRATQSIDWYLEIRGLKNRRFSSKDPQPMNAVLSVCRAMTQHPLDLTDGPYPASKVEYVPFFPARLGPGRDRDNNH